MVMPAVLKVLSTRRYGFTWCTEGRGIGFCLLPALIIRCIPLLCAPWTALAASDAIRRKWWPGRRAPGGHGVAAGVGAAGVSGHSACGQEGRPCARGRTVHPRPHTVNAGDARSTGRRILSPLAEPLAPELCSAAGAYDQMSTAGDRWSSPRWTGNLPLSRYMCSGTFYASL